MADVGTVAAYLKTRLEQLGLDRMFGVAGNYTAAFLDTILQEENPKITISGNANEICAGFAADGYARYKGIGAVYVTYSVGAFTALNTIAGAFVEQVPIVLINGAPTSKEVSIESNEGVLFSHTTGYKFIDIDLFRPITVAAERITNASQAPFQIDSALTALVTTKKPVYLEVVENVWRAACKPPEGEIVSGAGAIITVSEVRSAVNQTISMLERRPKFVFWAGAEIIRFGLEQTLMDVLNAASKSVDIPEYTIGYVTSASSKSVLSENNKYYQGTYEFSNEEIDKLVGTDGTIIGLGSWITGKNTGNESIRGDGRIFVANNYAMVGSEFFPSVNLKEYMEQLAAALGATNDVSKKYSKLSIKGVPSAKPQACLPGAVGITYDEFYASLGNWITEDNILVVDAGFPLLGAQSVHIPSQGGFVAEASWLSIGYSVPAATGVKCANPDKRAVVVVGDGAFHETCQAVSDQAAYGQDTVVFVLANGLYGIEQYLVNPNPFRDPPTNYPEPLLNAPYKYNVLPRWDFPKIAEVFGGKGLKASTTAELKSCFDEINANPDVNFVVEVTVPELDTPSILKPAEAVGEDETLNPNWPPKAIF